jgi:NUMOD3 motif
MSEAKRGKPHPHKSHPISEETKRKIGDVNRKPKPPRTEEHSKKISKRLSGKNNPNYDKKFSEETKQKMRAAHAKAGNGRRQSRTPWNKGKALSAEHRKKIAQARKGKPHPHK